MNTKLRDWNRAQDIIRRWDVEGEGPKRRDRVSIEVWKSRFLTVAEADNLMLTKIATVSETEPFTVPC